MHACKHMHTCTYTYTHTQATKKDWHPPSSRVLEPRASLHTHTHPHTHTHHACAQTHTDYKGSHYLLPFCTVSSLKSSHSSKQTTNKQGPCLLPYCRRGRHAPPPPWASVASACSAPPPTADWSPVGAHVYALVWGHEHDWHHVLAEAARTHACMQAHTHTHTHTHMHTQYTRTSPDEVAGETNAKRLFLRWLGW